MCNIFIGCEIFIFIFIFRLFEFVGPKREVDVGTTISKESCPFHAPNVEKAWASQMMKAPQGLQEGPLKKSQKSPSEETTQPAAVTGVAIGSLPPGQE